MVGLLDNLVLVFSFCWYCTGILIQHFRVAGDSRFCGTTLEKCNFIRAGKEGTMVNYGSIIITENANLVQGG